MNKDNPEAKEPEPGLEHGFPTHFKIGHYLVDYDRCGRIRARFILKRLEDPFSRIYFLDEKVKAKFPNAELIRINRCRCDDGSKFSWWVIKWDRERRVLKYELYREAKKNEGRKITL